MAFPDLCEDLDVSDDHGIDAGRHAEEMLHSAAGNVGKEMSRGDCVLRVLLRSQEIDQRFGPRITGFTKCVELGAVDRGEEDALAEAKRSYARQGSPDLRGGEPEPLSHLMLCCVVRYADANQVHGQKSTSLTESVKTAEKHVDDSH